MNLVGNSSRRVGVLALEGDARSPGSCVQYRACGLPPRVLPHKGGARLLPTVPSTGPCAAQWHKNEHRLQRLAKSCKVLTGALQLVDWFSRVCICVSPSVTFFN